MRKTTGLHRMTCVFLFSLCVGSVIAGLFIGNAYMSELKRFKDYDTLTKAVISDIQLIRYDDDGDPVYRVFVDFTTKNGDYIVHAKLGNYSSRRSIGDTVAIYYNPDNPYDLMTTNAVWWLVPLFFFFTGYICLRMGLIFLSRDKEKQKNEVEQAAPCPDKSF